jgi:hypothetical protein
MTKPSSVDSDTGPNDGEPSGGCTIGAFVNRCLANRQQLYSKRALLWQRSMTQPEYEAEEHRSPEKAVDGRPVEHTGNPVPDGGTDGTELDERRRRVLLYGALGLLGGAGVAGGLFLSQQNDSPEPSETPTQAQTTTTDTTETATEEPTEEVPPLVRRFAPDLYFGALEKWYPTDPRDYVKETAKGPIVDGFTALEEYSAGFDAAGTPPRPTVFYNVVAAADGIDAVQFWLYSVFDQFTVNFHWHDWELLQVFVDRETGSPLLVSASAHSRSVPNNEFIGTEALAGRRPGILAEVGSHSSASEVNDVLPSFERLPDEDWHSDVTNDVLDVTSNVIAPFAYGLPRGEGARLPFVFPELDGVRLDEHPELSLDREHFIDERVTVGSWLGLPSPPADIPLREPGLVMTHGDSEIAADADATYALESIEVVREAAEDFVGPQLSFEFAIPGFVEDKLASHITSVGIPWEQERYSNPLADVTDPAHRRQLDGDAPSGLTDRVVGRVRQLRAGADGTVERVTDEAKAALQGAIDVSLYSLPLEAAVQLSSEEPVATVTRGGVFGYLHVAEGTHRIVVNGPGLAPLAVGFVHEGGLKQVGAGGELTVVANEDAGWIRGDGRESTGIERVRVTEDYAGVVFEGRPVQTDRFAVAVHREGQYTVEVVDGEGRPGAYRVGPDSFGDDGEVIRETVETGKGALADTLEDEIAALRDLAGELAAADGGGKEVLDRLSRAREEAAAAASISARGEADAANEHLSAVVSILEEILDILASERQDGYSDAAVAALVPRVRAAIDRAEEAIETELA